MNTRAIEILVTRIALIGGTAAILLAFVEGLVQLSNHSLVGYVYAPSRILEIGAALLILAAAFLLRQIRDELRAR